MSYNFKTTVLLQFDKKWESDRGFVFYDFNAPTSVPESLIGSFDLVVVDPPFIVREVWVKYAVTSKLLLKAGNNESGMMCAHFVFSLCLTDNRKAIR